MKVCKVWGGGSRHCLRLTAFLSATCPFLQPLGHIKAGDWHWRRCDCKAVWFFLVRIHEHPVRSPCVSLTPSANQLNRLARRVRNMNISHKPSPVANRAAISCFKIGRKWKCNFFFSTQHRHISMLSTFSPGKFALMYEEKEKK